MPLLSLLVPLIVAALGLWAVDRLLTAFSVQEPMRGILWVAAVVLSVLWLLGVVGL